MGSDTYVKPGKVPGLEGKSVKKGAQEGRNAGLGGEGPLCLAEVSFPAPADDTHLPWLLVPVPADDRCVSGDSDSSLGQAFMCWPPCGRLERGEGRQTQSSCGLFAWLGEILIVGVHLFIYSISIY